MKAKINEKNSICGLDCADCPCFIAYQNDNDKLRMKTAKKWKEEFDWSDLKSEDINCLGCLSLNEPLFRHCRMCGVRKCGLEKRIKNCGECEIYDTCKKIASLRKMIPDGKEVCDQIRRAKE